MQAHELPVMIPSVLLVVCHFLNILFLLFNYIRNYYNNTINYKINNFNKYLTIILTINIHDYRLQIQLNFAKFPFKKEHYWILTWASISEESLYNNNNKFQKTLFF